MASCNQTNALHDALNKVILYHIDEFDLTLATVIGVLEFLKLELYRRVIEEDNEEDDDA